jgi:hypothetical protein
MMDRFTRSVLNLSPNYENDKSLRRVTLFVLKNSGPLKTSGSTKIHIR